MRRGDRWATMDSNDPPPGRRFAGGDHQPEKDISLGFVLFLVLAAILVSCGFGWFVAYGPLS